MAFSFGYTNYRKLSLKDRTDCILKRSANREHFFRLLVRLVTVALEKKIRMVIENPWSEQTFLKANFVMPPTFVDMDRTKRGDYYRKPTAYWFLNCEPTNGKTFMKPKEHKTFLTSRGSKVAGVCSEERSMISSDYARNFICDFILGKNQKFTELSLF